MRTGNPHTRTRHVAPTGPIFYRSPSEPRVNTFDLILRPGLADDPRCDDILRRLIGSVMAVFPKESETALQDSLVAALQDVDGRCAKLNLLKISADPGPGFLATNEIPLTITAARI